ncbi:anthranilate synthase component I family protein [Candidatus Sumerlaeota bacterium]|nr:anthranilate synthase component I family protein [Candidatus Sumerlaeota bacterium]
MKEAVFEALHSAGAQTNTDEHRDGASSEAPIEDWRSDWTPSLDPSQYKGAVERILEYIRAGDVYQANLTIRYRREFHAAPHLLFSQLLRTNPAPFSTFIQADDWAVAGSSPELLLDLRRDGSLQTRPIKGTISRSENDGAKRLLASAKDRAEHLMIVDLERNDLGKVCEFGSVYVDPMMRIESYAGLHHMVSSVRGRIRAGLSPADALAALFPGGSVTGAPKIRAMEIIHELEPVPRGIYTGAIGWITPEGESRMSLAIRTMTCHDGIVDLHVGGGIVADSDPEKEAEECALKGRAMARAAEGTLFIG